MDLFRLFGDVNGDRTVNGLDLALFRSAFGTSLGNPNYLDYLDQNGDGTINGLDQRPAHDMRHRTAGRIYDARSGRLTKEAR
jgi:hypothetical protein